MEISLNQIKAPIKEEMQSFEKHFRDSMKSSVPLLDKITHYIVKRKGKQMRPMFVFLSSKLFGETTDSTYRAASLIELLHTATLVHDDVVDEAYKRRGFFSINALWKNKIAVLVGDYLLSRGLLLSVENEEFDLLKIVSTSVKLMSEGELLQIEKARRLDISEEVYFDIITKKTATLIASCCATGAKAANQNVETVERMRLFGEKVGICFQIKDDLFDYGSGEDIGKPSGIDIKEKKMTLPLIHALSQAPKRERRKIINTVKNNNNDDKKVQEVINFVLQSGGIQYASEKMYAYRDEALSILNEFPENEARESLKNLVLFTTERKK
ncbi:MAG: polyprenyl synthetase [Flavobacteriales bacterium]|nr:polyprenyl synthetase [Flavobacteriales bacterium]|tara:strand:- start:55364 stop:56341 length:978 start_codon:yes stop_codon:yes gene_type:complete